MENILTVAGCSQLLLSLLAMDWTASLPGLTFGIVVFAILVTRVREVLNTLAVPAPKAATRARY
jgi:hypothetical protein